MLHRFRRVATSWPQPDFLPGRVKPPALAWFVLLAFAAVAAVALDEWVVLETERRYWDARIDVSVPAKEREHPATQSAGRQAAARQAWAVAASLEHPWGQFLASIERHTAQGVRWLGLEHDAERASVRISGVAPDGSAILATLESLAEDPLWGEVQLLRLDAASPDDTTGERKAMRFDLSARFGAPARRLP